MGRPTGRLANGRPAAGTTGLTAADVILATLYRMVGGHGPFGAAVPESELIVRSWHADPVLFGLQGYERQHPDSNRVKVALCCHTPKSLQTRGLISRLRPLTWTLTEAGIAAAKKLLGGTVAA